MEDRSARSTAYMAMAAAFALQAHPDTFGDVMAGLCFVMALYYCFPKVSFKLRWWKS